MASVAPAACSFRAMPQAIERLLASPKTTAVLPARLIILLLFLQISPSGPRAMDRATEPLHRISASRVTTCLRVSPAQVDKFHFAYGPLQEPRAKAFELFHRIGGEAANLSG